MTGQSSASAMRTLVASIRAVHASLDIEQTLTAVADGVIAATGFGVAAVNLLRADGTFEAVAVAGSDEARDVLLGQVGSAAQWQALLGQSHEWGDLRFIAHDEPLANDDTLPSWVPDEVGCDEGAWHANDILFAPLTSPTGGLIGMLSVDAPRDGQLPDADQRELLSLFAHHASVAVEHALLHQQLQRNNDELAHAASHDPLTGLYNRSVLRNAGPRLASRPNSIIGVLVIDLNDFKQLNDTHGHHAGDELLTILAERMQRCMREGDLLIRAGGDEFVALVSVQPGRDADVDLAGLQRRLHGALQLPVRIDGRIHLPSACIGVAAAATPADFDELLKAADAAMYHRKIAQPVS